MEGQLKEAFTVLNGIGSTIFNYALFAAAVGTIVMALLELLKALFYARRRFHEYEMRRWLDGRKIDRVLDILRLDGSSGSEPWREFIELVTGGYATKRAVFDQPIEKLMAQIQAATNMALDFPDRYPALFGFLTMRPPLKPATPAGTPLPRSDAELWQSAAKLRGESAISNEMRISGGNLNRERHGTTGHWQRRAMIDIRICYCLFEVFCSTGLGWPAASGMLSIRHRDRAICDLKNWLWASAS